MELDDLHSYRTGLGMFYGYMELHLEDVRAEIRRKEAKLKQDQKIKELNPKKARTAAMKLNKQNSENQTDGKLWGSSFFACVRSLLVGQRQNIKKLEVSD